MEKIITRDKDGNKIIVQYSQELIKDQEPQTDIVIDSYNKFKLCLTRSQEESQYAGGKGDKRYERALRDLVAKDHALYEEYYKKLRDEFNGK